VEAHLEGLTPANPVQLVKQYDVVVDASDNAPTRYLIRHAKTGQQAFNCWALHGDCLPDWKQQQNFACMRISRNQGEPSVQMIFADVYHGVIQFVLAVMRAVQRGGHLCLALPLAPMAS
jgi:hypothetical protein